MSRLVSRVQMAELLGVCERTVDRWRKMEGFPPTVSMPGHTVRWRLETVEEWLKRQEEAAPSQG